MIDIARVAYILTGLAVVLFFTGLIAGIWLLVITVAWHWFAIIMASAVTLGVIGLALFLGAEFYD